MVLREREIISMYDIAGERERRRQERERERGITSTDTGLIISIYDIAGVCVRGERERVRERRASRLQRRDSSYPYTTEQV